MIDEPEPPPPPPSLAKSVADVEPVVTEVKSEEPELASAMEKTPVVTVQTQPVVGTSRRLERSQPSGKWMMPLAIFAGMLVIAGVLMFRGGGGSPDGGGTDGDEIIVTPASDVEETAEAIMYDFAKSLGVAMDSLADEVDEGVITNWEQLAANSNAYTKAARDKAFMPMNEMANKNVPGGTWGASERKQVSTYLRQVANGHRSAAE